MDALAFEGVTKRYGGRLALDGLTFRVPEGGVYGFLGPNGAGKTTAIRVALTLIRPSGGEVQIFGQSARKFPAVLQRVGFASEGASFYPFLSGAENLAVLCEVRGIPLSRVDESLRAAGLADRGKDRVAGYSTGMRVRLGIAAALLHRPSLLLLDEPSNGLDPEGMAALREQLRQLAADGVTIFLSSHVLTDVEQLCERVAILHHGRVIREGRVADLTSGAAGVQFVVAAADRERTQAILEARGYVTGSDGDTIWVEAIPYEAIPALVAALTQQSVSVYSVRPTHGTTLEKLFLSLTSQG